MQSGLIAEKPFSKHLFTWFCSSQVIQKPETLPTFRKIIMRYNDSRVLNNKQFISKKNNDFTLFKMVL